MDCEGKLPATQERVSLPTALGQEWVGDKPFNVPDVADAGAPVVRSNRLEGRKSGPVVPLRYD
jgi:hypothetical protein